MCNLIAVSYSTLRAFSWLFTTPNAGKWPAGLKLRRLDRTIELSKTLCGHKLQFYWLLFQKKLPSIAFTILWGFHFCAQDIIRKWKKLSLTLGCVLGCIFKRPVFSYVCVHVTSWPSVLTRSRSRIRLTPQHCELSRHNDTCYAVEAVKLSMAIKLGFAYGNPGWNSQSTWSIALGRGSPCELTHSYIIRLIHKRGP